MKTNALKTPILFLVFNRLETTKRVFSEIRKAKPKQLFVSCDGPRENKPGEKETVEKIRKYVLKNVDWPCKVKTLFRKKNLGCKYAVSGAIDWFFENVEQGIILEDDCLPNQSFFRFCEELLKKYKDEEKVMMISGTNFIDEKTSRMEESYYFSKNAHIWGWASWRRAWKDYDCDIRQRINIRRLLKISYDPLDFLFNRKKLSDLKKNKVKTWDYQWEFVIKIHRGLCIIPKVNLIENIGLLQKIFTNAKPNRIDLRYLYKKKKRIDSPLVHPKEIKLNKRLELTESLLNLKRVILKMVSI